MAEGREEKGFRKCVFSQKKTKQRAQNHSKLKMIIKQKKKHTKISNLKLLCEGGVYFSALGNGRQGGRGTTALS